MRIIITDTNVLFDVIKIGALPEFFSLDYEICTTVFVIAEILPTPQRHQAGIERRSPGQVSFAEKQHVSGIPPLLTGISSDSNKCL